MSSMAEFFSNWRTPAAKAQDTLEGHQKAYAAIQARLARGKPRTGDMEALEGLCGPLGLRGVDDIQRDTGLAAEFFRAQADAKEFPATDRAVAKGKEKLEERLAQLKQAEADAREEFRLLKNRQFRCLQAHQTVERIQQQKPWAKWL